MGFLSKLGVNGILALMEYVFNITHAFAHEAEAANPAPGAGVSKLNAVMDKVAAVIPTIPMVIAAAQETGKEISDAAHAGDLAVVMNGVQAFAGIAVSAANAAGIFQKAGVVKTAPALDAAATAATSQAVAGEASLAQAAAATANPSDAAGG